MGTETDNSTQLNCNYLQTIVTFFFSPKVFNLPSKMNKSGQIVVQIWKRNFIFGSNLLTDNDFVDIVEFVPIFISVM